MRRIENIDLATVSERRRYPAKICETCRARKSLSTPNTNGSAIPSPVSLRKSQWFPSNGGCSTKLGPLLSWLGEYLHDHLFERQWADGSILFKRTGLYDSDKLPFYLGFASGETSRRTGQSLFQAMRPVLESRISPQVQNTRQPL